MMDQVLVFQFTWTNFLVAALVLWALYFTLQFFHNFFQKINFFGKYQNFVTKLIRNLLLIYEPMVLLLLSSIFVLINPVFHGLIAGILLVVSFNYIKNYIAGRIVQLDNALAVGNSLQVREMQGFVSMIGRLGLYLKTREGLHFASYTQLYEEGFLILSGDEIGGFYELKILPENLDEKINYTQRLTDWLVTAPYLDQNHQPELRADDFENGQVNAKVLVRDESHLYDLIRLIEEWGFRVEILKK